MRIKLHKILKSGLVIIAYFFLCCNCFFRKCYFTTLLFIVTNYKLSNGDIKNIQFVVETDKDEITFDKKNAYLGLLRTLEKQVNHHSSSFA